MTYVVQLKQLSSNKCTHPKTKQKWEEKDMFRIPNFQKSIHDHKYETEECYL